MDIYFRHLYDADGIGEDRLCLSVFVASGINFEFGCFGKLIIIVLEKTHKEFDGFSTLIFDGSTNNAGGVAVEDERL